MFVDMNGQVLTIYRVFKSHNGLCECTNTIITSVPNKKRLLALSTTLV